MEHPWFNPSIPQGLHPPFKLENPPNDPGGCCFDKPQFKKTLKSGYQCTRPSFMYYVMSYNLKIDSFVDTNFNEGI